MQTYTTTYTSKKQIIYFLSQISSFDECKYFIIQPSTTKWEKIGTKNFWSIYKQFKEITEEKLDRIILARKIITLGDWCDFIEETHAYGCELRHMFPKGKLTKVNGEWRFYFNLTPCPYHN